MAENNEEDIKQIFDDHCTRPRAGHRYDLKRAQRELDAAGLDSCDTFLREAHEVWFRTRLKEAEERHLLEGLMVYVS